MSDKILKHLTDSEDNFWDVGSGYSLRQKLRDNFGYVNADKIIEILNPRVCALLKTISDLRELMKEAKEKK